MTLTVLSSLFAHFLSFSVPPFHVILFNAPGLVLLAAISTASGEEFSRERVSAMATSLGLMTVVPFHCPLGALFSRLDQLSFPNRVHYFVINGYFFLLIILYRA